MSRDVKYNKVSTGDRVGRLILLNVTGRSKNGSKIWLCQCDCGNTVEALSSSLNSGLKKSCGCLYEEVKGKQKITHGLSKSKTYNSWMAMKARCNNPNSEFYDCYGGRGIKVCQEWELSFDSFLLDMGERPEGMTLDRINVNKNYEKDNCRWTNNSEQGYNGRIRKNNKTGKTGVSYHKTQNKYQVTIGVENEQIYLGSYTTFKEAKRVREEAELEYYGYIKE